MVDGRVEGSAKGLVVVSDNNASPALYPVCLPAPITITSATQPTSLAGSS